MYNIYDKTLYTYTSCYNNLISIKSCITYSFKTWANDDKQVFPGPIYCSVLYMNSHIISYYTMCLKDLALLYRVHTSLLHFVWQNHEWEKSFSSFTWPYKWTIKMKKKNGLVRFICDHSDTWYWQLVSKVKLLMYLT